MAMNWIQFQPGLPMAEFMRRFGTQAQCEAALSFGETRLAGMGRSLPTAEVGHSVA